VTKEMHLPDGWVWTSLSDICDINPRRRENALAEEDSVTFVPMSAIDEITGTIARPEVRSIGSVRKGFTHFVEGDVLFAKITPSMENGKAAVVRKLVNGIGFGTTELHVIRPYDGVLAEFVYHYLRRTKFRDEAASHMTGTAGQLRVPSDYMRNVQIPLCPTNEQRRIIDRIQKYFEQLRIARQALKEVPPNFRQFRQSVLAKAFRGELTRRNPNDEPAEKLLERIGRERRSKWEAGLRAKGKDSRKYDHNGSERFKTAPPFELPDEWRWTNIGDIFEVAIGGTPSRKIDDYWRGDVPWVSSGEVAFSRIRDTKEHITVKGVENSSAKIRPAGTVLLAMIGEGKTRGQAAILSTPASTNQNVASILCSKSPISSEYVYWWLCFRYNETRSVSEGGAQPALNAARVKSIPIPIASLMEQKEIVSNIEELFPYADSITKTVEIADDGATILEQSILSKAFGGKLVPQDPSDEPVTVLLKRVKGARVELHKLASSPRTKLKAPRTEMLPKSHVTILAIIEKMGGDAEVNSIFEACGLTINDFWDMVSAEIKDGHIQRVQRGQSVFLRVKR
jgi:type I restriction enzyme, S subunit